jgi:hypothetical protein
MPAFYMLEPGMEMQRDQRPKLATQASNEDSTFPGKDTIVMKDSGTVVGTCQWG